MDDTIVEFLISIAPRLPFFILCLIGVVLAIAHARTLRGAATCAGAGFGCLGLASLIGIASPSRDVWSMPVVLSMAGGTTTPGET